MRSGAERRALEINRLPVRELGQQYSGPDRALGLEGSPSARPNTAQALRTKAEGLGYALRLLSAFELDPASRDN